MLRLLPLVVLTISCALTPSSLKAQAKLSLVDGSRIRGELLRETPDVLYFVDMDGVLHQVPRDQVKKLVAAKPFRSQVLEQLVDVDQENPEALYAVAAWAVERGGSLKSDGRRLARRVLGLAPGHEGAHQILGHVFALGEWHRSERDAERAVKVAMTAKGLVSRGDGWAKEEDLDAIEAAPADWIIVDMIWRSRAEVMTEQGMISWLGSWYPPEDAELVAQLKELSKRTGISAHGARRGGNSVILDGSRLGAEAIAADLECGRKWIIDTLKPKRDGLLDKPVVNLQIFKTLEGVREFGAKYKSSINIHDEDYYQRCLEAGEIRYGWMDLAINSANKPRWREAAVGRVAAGLMEFSWPRSFNAPLWLKMAVSHHAEYGVFKGKSSYFFVAPETPPSTLAEERRQLIILFESGEAPGLARLLVADDFTRMGPEDETMATVFLEFLLKKKFDDFHRYLYDGTVTGNAEKVFAATLGADPAQLERELAAWLGVEIDD